MKHDERAGAPRRRNLLRDHLDSRLYDQGCCLLRSQDTSASTQAPSATPSARSASHGGIRTADKSTPPLVVNLIERDRQQYLAWLAGARQTVLALVSASRHAAGNEGWGEMARTRLRRAVALSVTTLLAGSTTVVVSGVPTAVASGGASPVWTASFSGVAAVFPTTTPDGNLIANANPLSELTPTGGQVWQVPATASQQPINGVATRTDVNGNTYVPVQDGNGRYLESFDKTGASRWTTPALGISCCEMALGWDGHVYITGRPNPTVTHILGFDEATGVQTLDILTGDVTNLLAYPGGLIQVAGDTVSYYSYQGQPISSVSGGAPLSAYVGYSSASGGNGLVFNAGYSTISQFACSAPSVEAITPSGIQWTWTAPDNFGCGTFLTATPDGGVILTTETGSAYASISPAGTTRWTYMPTAPHSAVADLLPPIVDVNGNVALPFNYIYSTPTSPQAIGAEIDFVTQASSSTATPSLALEEGTCDRSRMASNASVDIGDNQLYVALVIDCPDQTLQTIQAFSELGLGANYGLSISTPGWNQVGSPSFVPANVQVAGVWPAPDGTHLALFTDVGPQFTYIARLTTASVKPYPALQVPGGYGAATFGPDSTAYLTGTDPAGRSDSVGQLLRVRPGATSGEILHRWPAGTYPRSIEYLGGRLYVETVAGNCSSTLYELDLDGKEIGSFSGSSDCGGSWQATTNLLSVESRAGITFFDPTTLSASTVVVSRPAIPVMGRDGTWSVLTGFAAGGQCGADMHVLRVNRTGATILDQPLSSVIPASSGRCDGPGVAVMSDLTSAVGAYDSAGVLHVYLVPPTGGIQHLVDIQNSADTTLARFATDDNGHLVIAHEQSVSCAALQPCEQIAVDVYSAAGLVSSSTFGGTFGDSDYLIGPISVNDGSIAVDVTRCDFRGCPGGLQPDIQVVSAPVMRENWHDPAALAAPPSDQLSLTATPSTQVVGKEVTLTATLRTSDGAPVPDTLVTFGATSGPDAGRFAAIVRTDATGTAHATRRGIGVGSEIFQAWVDSAINGVVDPGEPSATTNATWLPAPVTVLFIQGIASSSTCPSSSDFVGRVAWLRSSLTPLLGTGSKFKYYAYRSPYTSSPTCSPTSAIPNYTPKDSCWSLDDFYSPFPFVVNPVPGGGEATRLAMYLRSYLDNHPGETISIVSHSQGGVLASYVVKAKLSVAYTQRIRSIVTLDSPLRGINGIAAELLRDRSWCGNFDNRLDSAYDMLGKSTVIKGISDTARPLTKLFTVDADPGYLCRTPLLCNVRAVDDTHSRTWWDTAHIQVHARTHGDIWCGSVGFLATQCARQDGTNLTTQGRTLVRFTACAADALAPDCVAYAKS